MDKNGRKVVIVTAGPTNERMDAVMKITNMSTGALGAKVVEALLGGKDGYSCHAENVAKVYYIAQKLARRPAVPDGQACKIHDIRVESTQDLLNTLRALLKNPDEHIDAVVHSAAVGDYKGRYMARAEDLAREICGRNERDGTLSYEDVLSIIAHPQCALNDSTKLSSYEPNLFCMLDLTPKVIREIKAWSPDTLLVGFKLLEGVPEPELLGAAHGIQEKSGAEFVVANDLAGIGNGKHAAMLVGPGGDVVKRFADKAAIADEIAFAVMQGPARYRYIDAGDKALFEKLKSRLFAAGHGAVEDFLGYGIQPIEDKDVIENRMDQAYAQMPPEEYNKFLERYGLAGEG